MIIETKKRIVTAFGTLICLATISGAALMASLYLKSNSDNKDNKKNYANSFEFGKDLNLKFENKNLFASEIKEENAIIGLQHEQFETKVKKIGSNDFNGDLFCQIEIINKKDSNDKSTKIVKSEGFNRFETKNLLQANKNKKFNSENDLKEYLDKMQGHDLFKWIPDEKLSGLFLILGNYPKTLSNADCIEAKISGSKVEIKFNLIGEVTRDFIDKDGILKKENHKYIVGSEESLFTWTIDAESLIQK